MTKPSDLLTHLAGTWHLERSISNGGIFQGLAHIRPTDMRGVYSYHEEGTFLREEVTQPACRDYLFKVSGKTLNILFADPHRDDSLYVSLDFSGRLAANDTYFCGDDTYGHIFEIVSLNHFRTETIVSGPEKDYRLITNYKRL